jgi:pimeloyl-[acyl-carrier protein] methyl ester esterase
MHLVLLPGLDGTGVLFRPLVAALPHEITSVVVTYPCDEPLGYDALLPRVLAALPSGEPFVVLGESFAGPIALRVAAARPAGLAGVVLCATFVRSPHRGVARWLGHAVGPSAMRLFPAASQVKMLLGGYSTPELRALSAEALSLVRPEVLAARLQDVLAVDVTTELAACDVPVLYLRGSRDMVVPSHNLREIRRIRPSVEVAVLPAPHLVLQTQPAASAAAITRFAAALSSRPSPP